MIEAFIERWAPSGAGERGNYQMFLTELCAELGLEQPHPKVPDESRNASVFDKAVQVPNRDGSVSTNFIDLYRRGHFVPDCKQGVNDAEAKTGHGVRAPARRFASVCAPTVRRIADALAALGQVG